MIACWFSRSKKRNSRREASSFPTRRKRSLRKVPSQLSALASSTTNGKKIEFNVKVGDKVLFSKYGGTEIKIDGENYLIMREDDILGIIG